MPRVKKFVKILGWAGVLMGSGRGIQLRGKPFHVPYPFFFLLLNSASIN